MGAVGWTPSGPIMQDDYVGTAGFTPAGPVEVYPWRNMTLINGFTAGAITPQFMKDSRGVVHFRGSVVCPGGGQLICWVPVAGCVPDIASASQLFIDWQAGGGNPSRCVVVGRTAFQVGFTAAGAAGAAGVVALIDRVRYVAAAA